MSWESIPGFSEDILPFYAQLARQLPQGARFVEVGVFLGRSVAYLGTLRPDLDLWAVDAWTIELAHQHDPYKESYGSMWRAFLGGMRDHAPDVLERLHIVRAQSTAVSIPDVDAAFIDAGHDFPDVQADIAHWTRHLKPGGLLCGHDLGHVDVYRAVTEAFGTLDPGSVGRPSLGPPHEGTLWQGPDGQMHQSTCWAVRLP